MRRLPIVAAVVLVVSLAVGWSHAGAHTELIASEPIPGQTVGEVDEIRLIFAGEFVIEEGVEVTLERRSDELMIELGEPRTPSASSIEVDVIGELPTAGDYVIRYVSTAADEGDRLPGGFAFTFDPSLAPADGGTDGVRVGALIVAGLAALSLVGMGVVVAMRRSSDGIDDVEADTDDGSGVAAERPAAGADTGADTGADGGVEPLDRLTAGMPLIVGGDRIVRVPAQLAQVFEPGDRLLAIDDTADLLHLPADEVAVATEAVDAAHGAFASMGTVTDDAITAFYDAFARRLSDDETFAPIAEANAADIERARSRRRSTTRLELTDTMRDDMVAGLRGWRDAPSQRDRLVEEIRHAGWRIEQRTAGLGVVGFVFEGRPNVFADATGVLRGGNTVVFRIGSDALGTARAIVEHALDPALAESGLPPGAVTLVDSSAHAAGWALFSDPRLALAVARGSGFAVHQLGSIARQAGIPVSLHGTGGAWMVAGAAADPAALAAAVTASLDRKVCNTLNVCCVPADRAAELVPVVLDALTAAADARDTSPKLHVAVGSEDHVPDEWFERTGTIVRADGSHDEVLAEPIDLAELGTEWEWEHSPEISLVVTRSVDEAVELCNQLSPRLVATLVSEDAAEHDRFWDTVDTPFVGNGFTRWVDGQYALSRPELGLSNWEHGRLFARSGVLSGDSVHTIRTRAIQDDPKLRR